MHTVRFTIDLISFAGANCVAKEIGYTPFSYHVCSYYICVRRVYPPEIFVNSCTYFFCNLGISYYNSFCYAIFYIQRNLADVAELVYAHV